mgnify:CR=1 FL=1
MEKPLSSSPTKIEEIKKIADRCAILHRGKLVDVLDVASTSSQTMANMMVGRQVEFKGCGRSTSSSSSGGCSPFLFS